LGHERQAAKRALAKLNDMETAWKQAEERTAELQIELKEQQSLVEALQAAPRPDATKAKSPPVSPTKLRAQEVPPAALAELYQQAVTPLTVLVASADMLVMSPALHPSLRETATEVKTQAETLLDLIKKHARPQDSR
jgi:hypothetical protein